MDPLSSSSMELVFIVRRWRGETSNTWLFWHRSAIRYSTPNVDSSGLWTEWVWSSIISSDSVFSTPAQWSHLPKPGDRFQLAFIVRAVSWCSHGKHFKHQKTLSIASQEQYLIDVSLLFFLFSSNKNSQADSDQQHTSSDAGHSFLPRHRNRSQLPGTRAGRHQSQRNSSWWSGDVLDFTDGHKVQQVVMTVDIF